MTSLDLSRAVWRKSSHSGSGEGTCIEVAAVWRKSSRSQLQASECVEVARVDRLVAVRDSKNPDGPVLTFAPSAWYDFLTEIRTNSPT